MRWAPGRYWNITCTNFNVIRIKILSALLKEWSKYAETHGIDRISTTWMWARHGVPALVVEIPEELDISIPGW
jgi:hypothetical protein